MGNNYDLIAPIYDPLSKLIFADSQRRAQIEQLKDMVSGSHILIAGGGTGWILEEIHKLSLTDLTITYLEVSTEMIRLAAKREIGNLKVQFVQNAAEHFESPDHFDYILTGFLFDNLSAEKAGQVFKQFDKMMNPGGYWFYTDFQSSVTKQKWWQRILLGMMYRFFKIVSGVQERQVPDIFPLFNQSGYQLLKSAMYYRGFIQAVTYQKHRSV